MQKVEAYLKMIISTYSSISPCKSKNASAWHLGLAIFLSVVWQAIGIAHITEKTFKLTVINTLASGRFWDFKKNTETHVALHRNFSSHISAMDLVEVSKDAANLLVCTRKKIFWWGVQIFCE